MRVPTLEWAVVGACNYACTYCIQSARKRRGSASRQQVAQAISHLAALPGAWEIKLSGGEPFVHPLFLDRVVPGLMELTPHRISVLTNFSADARALMRFVALTRGRLSVFSASLHLEAVAIEAFSEKAGWFADLLEPEVSFVVNQVLIPGREHEALRCQALLADRGIAWFPQLLKQGDTLASYPDSDALHRVLRLARRANLAPDYRGRRCWAGVEYVTVDREGEAWSCRGARRAGEGRLGNLYRPEGLSLLDAPQPCAYPLCPCTVPAHRGLVEGVVP